MKLTQVKGDTWVIEANEFIPIYRMGQRCVLMDTGLAKEREEIERTLLDAGLTPAAVLCTHAHVDHCANNGYFQEKYRVPVALTAPEAGMCSSLLTLKCYFLTLPPGVVEKESSCMIHRPDVILPPEDGPFSFCGAEFQILHTPGHSAGHICVITPDNVCYAADALLSWENQTAKLPYNLSHAMAAASREKLRHLGCHCYILAHKGLCPGDRIGALIDANRDLLERRAGEILALVTRPMTASEIDQAACGLYRLFTHRTPRALRFERNVRFLIEYLVDGGRLEMECRDGVIFYAPPTAP